MARLRPPLPRQTTVAMGVTAPLASSPHPPITAAHTGLMTVRYYLFDVTRGDQVLCAAGA